MVGGYWEEGARPGGCFLWGGLVFEGGGSAGLVGGRSRLRLQQSGGMLQGKNEEKELLTMLWGIAWLGNGVMFVSVLEVAMT